jgi:hypothetical protein
MVQQHRGLVGRFNPAVPMEFHYDFTCHQRTQQPFVNKPTLIQSPVASV